MAAGGRMMEKEREKQEMLGRASPTFMLAQIKKAIPPHCLQCSVIRSFSYVVYDLVIIASLLYAALVWIPGLPSMQQLGACPLYWVCGHHAFSDYLLLDNMVRSSLSSCLALLLF
ncbi:hypothetical protein VPH35_002367 [Triticum aestivum]